jgi:hypothetical protein
MRSRSKRTSPTRTSTPSRCARFGAMSPIPSANRSRPRYTKSSGQWAIYWRDRNLKLHEYDRKRPTKNVQSLLDWIANRDDPIFWG